MAEQDYYKILGIERGADDAAIKKAYRKLAMKYHPDQNKGDAKAEAKFKEISQAYEVLKDEQKRAAYDRYGAAAFDGSMGGGAGGAGAGFGNFSDIFEDMFGDFMGNGGGGRGGRGGAQRGSDIQYGMEITLEDAYKGKDAKIKIPVNDTCSACDGSGAGEGSSAESCGTCAGQGRVRQQQGFFTIERACPTCAGAGKTIKDPCKKCRGQGRTRTQKTMQVKIPAGIEAGRRIRLTGEGEAGLHGGPRGDLYVLINIKDHKFFKRNASNLYCRVPIPMTQAALGGEIEVPTIEGKRAKVKIPAGTQTGQQFRLRGKGMSVMRSKARGDMFIETFVETPVNLNKKQKEIMEDLSKSMNGGKKSSHGGGGSNSPESSGFFDKMKDLWDDLKD